MANFQEQNSLRQSSIMSNPLSSKIGEKTERQKELIASNPYKINAPNNKELINICNYLTITDNDNDKVSNDSLSVIRAAA